MFPYETERLCELVSNRDHLYLAIRTNWTACAIRTVNRGKESPAKRNPSRHGAGLFCFHPQWLPFHRRSTAFSVCLAHLCEDKTQLLTRGLVPLGVGAALLQSSLYDVPGGYRAVMFDRFSGVKDKVRLCCYKYPSRCAYHLWRTGITGRDTFPRPGASACYPLRRPH